MKCAVKDCTNHSHEGLFRGLLCSPCHAFIAGDSDSIYSQAYRNVQSLIDAERERVIQAATKLAEEQANALIAEEREACAKFCETNQVWVGGGKRGFTEWGHEEFVTGGRHQGMDYAAAIRARSKE